MSVIAYARMTRRRERSRPATAGSEQRADEAPPDSPSPVGQPTIDAFAALVPAELLVAHATILQVTTETEGDVTTITEPGVLGFSFWALIGTSILLYLVAKAPSFDRLDGLRMLIPAAAIAGWMMVQKTTAFDAAFSMNEALRIVIPVLVALLLVPAARSLAYQADNTEK